MEIDVKTFFRRLNELSELAAGGISDLTVRAQIEMGIDSILRALDTTTYKQYEDYIEEQRNNCSEDEMNNVYVGVLRSIKSDIEMGLVPDFLIETEGEGFVYKFSDDDFERVQVLINELRDLISKSKDFEADHKRRLLKRLEKLQSELHKKMSSLDMLWGLIGDAGVALGKFGKNAKPFTDRIGEILQIVCRIQAKAENVKGTLPLRLLTGEQTDLNEKES